MRVHRAILTPRLPGTTFAAEGLNFRVRDVIGCFPFAIDTPKMCQIEDNFNNHKTVPEELDLYKEKKAK